MIPRLFIVTVGPLLLFCLNINAQKPQKSYEYMVFMNPDRTYGYDIRVNGKLTIHQPVIPGRPGNSGFKTRKDAGKVAQLAIAKMKKGMPLPTIDENELKQLNL